MSPGDGTVYIGSRDKKVYALDASTGQAGASWPGPDRRRAGR
ncbi:PQQ-binding-like beta-propeller repeat protein [Streptomyces sp. NPDC056224]